MKRFLESLAPIWRPHPGQLEFLIAPASFKVLACGRRWGKTDACAARILHDICQPKPSRSLILAPTLDQARLLFDRVLDLFEKLLERWPFKTAPPEGKPRRTPYPSIRLGKHIVSARSGHLSRALRGNEADHILIDEAAFVPEELVAEVAMPMLATTKGSLTMISTPRGLNHFWKFFRMGQDGRHGIWSRRAPSSESPYVSKEFLDVQRELISERAYQTEYEAVFQDSEFRVFKTAAIDAALCVSLEKEQVDDVFIGIDWAKYSDYSAVVVLTGNRQEARLLECARFNGLSWPDQIRRVQAIIERYDKPNVLCDATGVGDPLVTDLQARCRYASVRSFTFTSASKPALIENLVWMFENRAIRMEPDPHLLRELEHFESSLSRAGNSKLEAGSGYSDDLVIALALAAMEMPKSYRASIQVGGERRFSDPT